MIDVKVWVMPMAMNNMLLKLLVFITNKKAKGTVKCHFIHAEAFWTLVLINVDLQVYVQAVETS